MTALQPLKHELSSRLQHQAPPGLVPAQLLDLAAYTGPLMPTLNGLLLGYPVVYAVDMATVDPAAAYLSSRPLRLCTLQGRLQDAGAQLDIQAQGSCMAWSVPDSVWNHVAGGMDSCIRSHVSVSLCFDLLHGAFVFAGWQAELITDHTVRL